MKAFNEAPVGVGPRREIQCDLVRRGEGGRIVGGVAETLSSDSLYLDIVWNGHSIRGQGHRRTMMRAIEAEGRRRGSRCAWLYTKSWQARPFYERLGYTCVSEKPFLEDRHRQYVMWKRL